MNGYPEGLLGALGINPEDLRRQSMTQGLLSAGLQMLAASGPSPVRQSLGQIVAQGGLAGMQGMQQAEESAIDRALKNLQLQSTLAQQRQAQEAAQRQSQAVAGLRAATQPVTAQTALSMPGRVGPTPERQTMIGQTPQMTRDQALQLALNPDLPKDMRESLFKYVETTAPKEPKAAPGVVGEYQAAKALGDIPPNTTLEQFIAMKKPPAAVATAISGGAKDVFGEKSQERQAARFSDISISGDVARRSLGDINRLDTLIGKIETGGAAAFKQAAGNFGIKTEGLDDIQAAQAIISRLVPAQRPPGSGTMSDADLAEFKASLPKIINQPGANREIIRSMREINQYLIKEGEIADMVLDGSITPAEGRKRLAALGNPIQDFFARTQQQPTAPRGSVRTTPQDNSLILKYLRPGQ